MTVTPLPPRRDAASGGDSMATIGGLLDTATHTLAASGSRTPRLDAEVLLGEALATTRTHLLTWPERAVPADAEARFAGFIARRSLHEPVAYIIGRRGFIDFELDVTRDVLIPRPETELLVEEALRWLSHRPHARIADIGTGSGAIAIALARRMPHAHVVGTDISAAALQLARRNAEHNGVTRIEWRAGDLCDALDETPFDLIVSNPPYVSAQEYAALEPNVREYEPKLALRAEEDGLRAIRQLCEQAPAHLVAGGALGFEMGATQGEAARRLMQINQFQQVRVIPDLAGHERVTWGMRWTNSSSKN
ncbi:MAG: peptide chain release factor N(5)-glutamine methyltransferase [Proteobacteria bacterium]|nr:peptide chain release factor N(5)-glutamine methyltransferase [Pseudomonadota bacterium]